jgi:hypothetical protein
LKNNKKLLLYKSLTLLDFGAFCQVTYPEIFGKIIDSKNNGVLAAAVVVGVKESR